MKKYLRLVLCLGFVLTFVFAAYAEEKLDPEDFSLKTLKGDTVVLSKYRQQQPTLLFFWTTWCPYCRDELKNLNNRYADLTNDGIRVFAVNLGEGQYKVENLASKSNFIFPVLLDERSILGEAFHIFGVPTYILLNEKGYVIFQDNIFPSRYEKILRGQ